MATLDTTRLPGSLAEPDGEADSFSHRNLYSEWHLESYALNLMLSRQVGEDEAETPAIEGDRVLCHDEVNMELVRRHHGKIKIEVTDEAAERVAALLKGEVPAPE